MSVDEVYVRKKQSRCGWLTPVILRQARVRESSGLIEKYHIVD
jgi:hypothetical protein